MFRRLAHDLLRRAGIRVQRLSAATDYSTRRRCLLRSLAVDAVIDVGANVGQYALETRRSGYGGQLISVEPLEDAFQVLAARAAMDGHWVAVNLALADAPGKRLFHIAGNSVSSSLLQMNERHIQAAPSSKTLGTCEVTTTTLDRLLEDLDERGRRLWVKMDAQGAEAMILRGCELTLPRTVAFELEMSLVELYSGETPFLPMIQEMATRGYCLATLENGFTDSASGRTLQVDGIFVRADAFA